MIGKLFLLQIAVSALVVTGIGFVKAAHQSMSAAVGAVLVTVSLVLLTWAWHLILSKKLIALAVSVIVFKYAIFGTIIYIVITKAWVDGVWFVVGVSTLLPTVLLFAIWQNGQNNQLNW